MTFWVAGAAVVGGLGGAYLSSQGASHAADAQAGAANQANQTQLQMYNQTRTDNLPALGARNDALARLEALLGVGSNRGAAGYGSLGGPLNVGDVTQDPGYQFGMQQGQRALNNSLNARGMRDSGAAMMAAARYGNDYGTTKYDDAFNRAVTNRQVQLNPLQSLAGLGQTGATTMATAGMNAGNNISQNQLGVGNAQAANSLAQGNIWGNATNQLAGWYGNYASGGRSGFGGGSSFGTPGLDQFFYGSGTSGD
jgi:hypothetical protein